MTAAAAAPATRETPRTDRASWIDPAALMTIQGLELRARMVVSGFWSGLHRSPRHGFSVEFTEYRPYTPGDDTRFLDWRLYARSDRFYIKRFEEETNLRCMTVLDNSRSMLFSSRAYDKQTYARTLAATLSYFLYQQGDGVGLMVFNNHVTTAIPARHRTGHLRRIMVGLERVAEGNDTNLGGALTSLAETLRKRSLLVVISDFLAPLPQILSGLAKVGSARHEIAAFQVLDPAEIDIAGQGASLVRDLETGAEIFVRAEGLAAEYRRRLAAHQAEIRKALEAAGHSFAVCPTDRPLESVLFEFLTHHERRRPWNSRRH